MNSLHEVLKRSFKGKVFSDNQFEQKRSYTNEEWSQRFRDYHFLVFSLVD